RERPCCRTADKSDELAPFHQQFLPCFEVEDSTAGDLLHCGISTEPLSAMGLGCVRTILWVVLAKIDSNKTPLTHERVIEFATAIRLLRGDDCFERFHAARVNRSRST